MLQSGVSNDKSHATEIRPKLDPHSDLVDLLYQSRRSMRLQDEGRSKHETDSESLTHAEHTLEHATNAHRT